MKTKIFIAPAKINLGCSILGKLPNGYHELKTIYTQVSLFDTLKIEAIKDNKIEIDCQDKNIPNNNKNLAYKAADLIKKQVKIKSGVKIVIKKIIPVGAGLGGGSSDAAAVLKGLNKLWHLNLSLIQLIKLAKVIGADVAYHLVGGLQLEIQGGKKAGQFIYLAKLPTCYIILCFPNLYINSKAAYQEIDYYKINKNNLELIIKSIKEKNLKKIADSLHNDFELWTFKRYPLINKIKKQLVKCGALGSLMSGKGSTVFGIFDNINIAKKALSILKKDYPKTFLVKPF